MNELLNLIEKHLVQTGKTETAFGIEAMNDRSLVRDIRNGRELRKAGRAKVMAIIGEEVLAE
jgi:hypothetical protein